MELEEWGSLMQRALSPSIPAWETRAAQLLPLSPFPGPQWEPCERSPGRAAECAEAEGRSAGRMHECMGSLGTESKEVKGTRREEEEKELD